MELFKDYDFCALDDPDYKEDAVREDIVTPILKRLGYQPTGENKMIRTKSLTHPFVYIGTKKHKVNIIPDYLLQVSSTYVFTLDAKAPNEDIRKGANVEQAFSYAIHPEIRTFYYGLCNGRDIYFYQWTSIDPILTIPIVDLDERWEELNRLVSPLALTKPHLLDFLPDFGLSYLKLGADKNMEFHFVGAWVNLIAKIDDNTYTLSSTIGEEDNAYLGSFDFTKSQYDQFIFCVPDRIKDRVVKTLSQQPYSISFTKDDSFELVVHAKFGEAIHTNEDEQYFPLTVVNFEPLLDAKQIFNDLTKE